ncbi:Hypothetical predicted protein [Mytilus galloprovincialis]|uniref:Uncharacterized protein n=1 Tax=Mytilus galloprovincialis TaxID=29158 RepID=A0A8B6DYV4_MYTGA|nr:Hypothetical predicted protein [Mytilus galloprovincialis]
MFRPIKTHLYANLRHVVPAVCLPGPFGSHFDECALEGRSCCAFMMNANPENHPNLVMDIIYDETPSLRMFITKNGGFQTLKRQLAQRFGPFKFEDDDDGKLTILMTNSFNVKFSEIFAVSNHSSERAEKFGKEQKYMKWLQHISTNHYGKTYNMYQTKYYMMMMPVKRSLKKQSLSYLNKKKIVLQNTCSEGVYEVLTCLSTIWEGAHVDVDVDIDVNIRDDDVTKADVIIGVVYKGDVTKADVSIDVDVATYEKVSVNTIDEESCDELSIYKI